MPFRITNGYHYAQLMADCTYFPKRLHFGDNGAEESVFGQLISQLPEETLVFHSMKFFNGDRDYEIDFVIAHPELGIALLEVKASLVRVRNGGWEQFNRNENKWYTKDIRGQLALNNRMLLQILKSEFGDAIPVVRGYLVTPDTEFPADAKTGQIARNQIIDSTQIENMWEHISYDLSDHAQDRRHQQLPFGNAPFEFLKRQFSDNEETYEEMIRSTKERGLAIEALSRNQVALLDFMSDNKRMLIRGGPGSGKTVLAIEQAARLGAAGLKTGLICYNIGLGQHLMRATGSLPRGNRLKFRGSLEALIESWDVQLPPVPVARAARDKFYRTEVPRLVLEHLSVMDDEDKFDAWVVDEAQELNPGYWKILKAALKDPENGIIHAFGDRDQEIFKRDEEAAEEVDWHIKSLGYYARGTLHKNLRNSRTIARILESISSRAAEPAGIAEGVTPEFVLVPDHLDINSVTESFVNYLRSNYLWESEHILVINTGEKLPQHVSLERSIGKAKYWNKFLKSDDVFRTHVSVVKGLERPMVVLVLDGFSEGSNIDQQLYVGLSRALDDVVIIGKAKEFEQIGETIQHFARSPFNDLLE